MNISFYQVDAFADRLFAGNPAGVCPLDSWLPDDLMQHIAFENNLAETAFFVHSNDGFDIRWFTPSVEVSLCGHATLASAHVIFNHLDYEQEEIDFHSKSGLLKVRKDGEMLLLNFPADEAIKSEIPSGLAETLGIVPYECYKGKTDYLLVFPSQEDIESIRPDFRKLKALPVRGLIVTAPGHGVDFVSRFFAPAVGVDEDPVTGSAHTTLIPYWSSRLGKQEMTATQLSNRKGQLKCSLAGDRVLIGGKAVTFIEGKINL